MCRIGKLWKNGGNFTEKEQNLIFECNDDSEYKDAESFFIVNGTQRSIEMRALTVNEFINLAQGETDSWLYIDRLNLTVMSSDNKYKTVDGNNYGLSQVHEGFIFESIYDIYEFTFEIK